MRDIHAIIVREKSVGYAAECHCGHKLSAVSRVALAQARDDHVEYQLSGLPDTRPERCAE